MHREVPVRLGKERWETYTATAVQGAHRLLHVRLYVGGLYIRINLWRKEVKAYHFNTL